MKSAYPIFATTILPELARFVPSSWSQHPSRISILFAFQSKLLHAHTWKHAARDEGRKRIRIFARHSWIRLDSTYRACVPCISYCRRARIGCVFLRGVSIRNVARGEAQCEWGLGEGIVHSTLLLLWHNLLSPLLLARATKSNPRRDGERGNESDDVKCYASK